MSTNYAKLKKESIAHYNRMIKWAKTQPKDGMAKMTVMQKAIGENWGGHYCSYCMMFIELGCLICPLYVDIESITHHHCCNNLWAKMNGSVTWSEWIRRAEAVREYIRENYKPKE